MPEHEFAVWAPTPGIVRLDVNGTVFPMTPSADGWWRAAVTAPDDARYGYLLDDDPAVLPDPRSPRQPDGVHQRSRLWSPGAGEWTDDDWAGRSVEGAVVYELHLGTFTAEGTFDSAIDKLDALVDLGADFVELMPVNAFDGTHGWGYDGVLWYAVHEPYGGPAGLVRFVDACHRRGLGVLLDVVFNHLGPSGNYLPRFGPYLSKGSNPWGEGINVGRGSQRVRVEGNIIHSTNHVLLYINRSQDNELIGNYLYHIPDPAIASKDGEYSAAIVIGDESGPAVSKWPNSRGNVIRGNVVVNAGKMFQVRNNSHNYDTRLVDTVIENNTFVAGLQTEQGIIIQSNVQGGRHGPSRFAANVIDFTHAAKGADIGTFGQGSGIVFAGNVWSEKPPQSMQNNDDIYGDVALVDAAASREPFNVDNYRPRAGSNIAARGLGALTAAGEEPPVDPPPDPDPEPGRDDIVRGVLAQQEELLETASAAITAARANAQYLIQLMNENQGEL